VTPLGVLVSGRGSNLDAIIRACRRGDLPGEVISVASNKPGCAALEVARQAGVPARLLHDPDDVADTYPDVPILGFTNHTDTSGLRAAHAAGFDQVLAKSALAEQLGTVVAELTGSAEP